MEPRSGEIIFNSGIYLSRNRPSLRIAGKTLKEPQSGDLIIICGKSILMEPRSGEIILIAGLPFKEPPLVENSWKNTEETAKR